MPKRRTKAMSEHHVVKGVSKIIYGLSSSAYILHVDEARED